jgi:hypothetical protein
MQLLVSSHEAWPRHAIIDWITGIVAIDVNFSTHTASSISSSNPGQCCAWCTA